MGPASGVEDALELPAAADAPRRGQGVAQGTSGSA